MPTTLREAIKREQAKGSDLERLLIFQLRAAQLPAPQREYRFHPVRRWRFDLAWPELKIAVEVEGGTWIYGSHNRGTRYAADCIKYNAAILAGWRVLRFDNKMVEDGTAVDTIRTILNAGH